jgi:predicted TIM-barrel fold metal-dependent hydrolase
MVIDFHTHCFPDTLAVKAIGRLSVASGGLTPYTDGTVAGLRRHMVEAGVSASVVLHIATNPTQQRKVNDFAAAIQNEVDIFSFGSVHPDAPDALEELDRIKALGLKGVKLHPDYQGFAVDDPKMKPIYRKISDLGLITVFHAGMDYGFPPPYGCMPDGLAKMLDCFETPVVAAHWGGLQYGEDVLRHLCGRNVYLDTSFGYGRLSKYHAEMIIEKHGTDRLLFATDNPWHTAAMEWRLLDTLGLSDEEREKIACTNAKRLLGMD